MSDFDKRMNLYKSTMGQIDKLIEQTANQEVIEELRKAKESVGKAQGIFVKSLWESARKVVLAVVNLFSGEED